MICFTVPRESPGVKRLTTRRAASLVLYNVVVTLVLIFLIEGTAGALRVPRRLVHQTVAERLDTGYDRDIGSNDRLVTRNVPVPNHVWSPMLAREARRTT
jgi:hypothetical protein